MYVSRSMSVSGLMKPDIIEKPPPFRETVFFRLAASASSVSLRRYYPGQVSKSMISDRRADTPNFGLNF